MALRIEIRPGDGVAVFPDAEITFSGVVFWHNGDSEPHAPMEIAVEPGDETASIHVVPTAVAPLPLPLPQHFTYGCDLHSTETGAITVWNDFVGIVPPLAVIKPATSIQVATGGKPPYEIVPSGVASVDLVETPQTATADAGIDAVLSNPPATVTFRLSASDALGNKVDQDVTINVT